MNCPRCGAAILPPATNCPCASTPAAAAPPAASASPPPVPATGPASPDNVVGFMIPTGNKPSLIAYYCVFGAWIPFLGIVPMILAIVFGIKGVRLARQYPQARGGCHAWFGIVGGVFVGLIGLVASVLIVIAILAESRHR